MEKLPEGQYAPIPSDNDLVRTYSEIEKTAIDAIRGEQVIGNPIFSDGYKEQRYAIASCGMLNESTAGIFLGQAVRRIEAVEPTIRSVPPEFLHLAFGEVFYTTEGRDKPGVNSSKRLVEYYSALRNNFPQSYDPIKLRLHRILPALDPPYPDSDKRSLSIVAGFLTEGDDQVFRIRHDIRGAVSKDSLEVTGRLGVIRVLFVTLGRLRVAPTIEEDRVPILDAIAELNNEIEEGHRTNLNYVQLLSTTTFSYSNPDKHAYVWPPIALRSEDQILDVTKILTPYQRNLRKIPSD